MNTNQLKNRLKEEFDCSVSERERVTRQARKLYNSGIYEQSGTDSDGLTIEAAISSLKAAAGHLSICSKWNWWMGLLSTGEFDFGQSKC